MVYSRALCRGFNMFLLNCYKRLLVLGLSVLVIGAFLPISVAFGDSMSVSPNGLYTATVFEFPGKLVIAGPNATESFFFGFPIPGPAPFVNNIGQVVGYTDGGTDDPALYFAVYGSGGSAGPFEGGNGGGFIGTIPKGVGFGSLGWPRDECGELPTCGGFVDGWPELGILTDSGWVGAEIIRTPLEPDSQSWQLPSAVPEPTSILLLVTVLGGLISSRRGFASIKN